MKQHDVRECFNWATVNWGARYEDPHIIGFSLRIESKESSNFLISQGGNREKGLWVLVARHEEDMACSCCADDVVGWLPRGREPDSYSRRRRVSKPKRSGVRQSCSEVHSE